MVFLSQEFGHKIYTIFTFFLHHGLLESHFFIKNNFQVIFNFQEITLVI